MNAYMVASNKKIEPFGDHPRDCLITNQKLDRLQEEVLDDMGLEFKLIPNTAQINDANEHIVFEDSLFFTKELLQEFISRSRKLESCTVCALKPGLSTIRTVVTTQDVQIYADRVEYCLHYLPPQRLRGDSIPVVIDPSQFQEGIPMPKHMMGAREYLIPMTYQLLGQIDHWANLWALNIAALLSEGARLQKGSKLKLLGIALKARSINRWKVLHQLNRVGQNCDIHPTAYIEASTIGDNVKIGAGAVIRESLVGSGTFIGNNATLELTVVGEESYIGNASRTQYCVLYPGSFFIARGMSCSMCGRDSFVGGGAVLSDFRFDGKHITVMKNGTQIDTGNSFMGSCIGHGVYLAAGSIVAPGRTIPNGVRIAPEESRIIRRCDAGRDVPGYRQIDAAI